MSRSPFRAVIVASVCLAWAVLSATGCREELGPEPMPTANVRGVVLQAGRPVAGGWVEFIPVEGTVGNLRSARLGPDGSFEADKVAVGKNALRLVNSAIDLPGGSIFASFQTPIRRAVPAQGLDRVRIDLLDEAVLFQESRARMAPRARENTP